MSAAFNISTMIRWLDFSDGFTAAQGGHPFDNIGGILATADYLSRKRIAGALVINSELRDRRSDSRWMAELRYQVDATCAALNAAPTH